MAVVRPRDPVVPESVVADEGGGAGRSSTSVPVVVGVAPAMPPAADGGAGGLDGTFDRGAMPQSSQ